MMLFLLSLFWGASTQDLTYVRKVLDTLTSPGMAGRGYVDNGEKIAAEFIRNEYERFGLKKLDNYFQNFKMPINIFPDTLKVVLDGKVLIPGEDYVVLSSSPSVNGKFDIVWLERDSTGKFTDVPRVDLTGKVLVTAKNQRQFSKELDTTYLDYGFAGIVYLQEDKPWWHVSDGYRVKDYFAIQIEKDKIAEDSKTISIVVENQFYPEYPTQNVIGFVEGKLHPDSFFVFTAHYDHLGKMGSQTYFPGANDNGSGTAALLDLAKYYSQPEYQPDISIAFLAFSAEEAGLIGSSYYASHPLFPLENIVFLINLDMVGSGSQGIKVVNGTVFRNEFETLQKINTENDLLNGISERGEAANSDHYPFYARGIPCFFIYTLGDECKEYHNIYDTSENVPFTDYYDLFRLLVRFEKTF